MIDLCISIRTKKFMLVKISWHEISMHENDICMHEKIFTCMFACMKIIFPCMKMKVLPWIFHAWNSHPWKLRGQNFHFHAWKYHFLCMNMSISCVEISCSCMNMKYSRIKSSCHDFVLHGTVRTGRMQFRSRFKVFNKPMKWHGKCINVSTWTIRCNSFIDYGYLMSLCLNICYDRSYKSRLTYIHLRCDPTKRTIEDASFEVKSCDNKSVVSPAA